MLIKHVMLNKHKMFNKYKMLNKHKMLNSKLMLTGMQYKCNVINILDLHSNFLIQSGFLNEGNFYVYWTDAGTGERHKSINMVTIPENINNSFATLHVYPTNKVEIVFSNNWPTETPKGLEYKKTIKKP